MLVTTNQETKIVSYKNGVVGSIVVGVSIVEILGGGEDIAFLVQYSTVIARGFAIRIAIIVEPDAMNTGAFVIGTS